MGKNKSEEVDSNCVKKRKKGFKSKAKRPLMSLASESPSENETQTLNNAKIFIDVTKNEELSGIPNISAPRVKVNYLGEFAKEKERKLTSLLFNDVSSFDDNEENYSSCEKKIIPRDSFIEDSNSIEHNEDVVEENLSEEIDAQRKPAWMDEDDQHILWKDVMKTAAPKAIPETDVKYQEILQEKFVGVYGETPQWAQLNEKPEVDEEESSINMTVGSYLETSNSVGKLPKTILLYEILKPLNSVTLQEGRCIRAITFEPDKSAVLVAGTTDPSFGGVTLFKFDGQINPKIKSIRFPNFPLLGAQFLTNNYEFIVGSSRLGSIIVCDVKTGNKTKSVFDKLRKNILKKFEISPDGKYIAFVGCLEMVIFEAKTMSLLEKLSVPSEVNAIAFHPEVPILYLFGKNGQVYLIDMDSWKCCHSFYDEGCIEGTALAVSPDGKRLACGSSSGVVNLYNLATLRDSQNPAPLKAFTTLVTPVTSLAFNATSELLAIASSSTPNAVKLIHTSSLTVFSNFPGTQWSFYKILCFAFSPDSKYLALGTDKKVALLVRLSHY